MRRKEKEVTDVAEIIKIIEECDCCRIGLHDGENIYIVPLNFGYTARDGHIDLYFHGAPVGKKIELMRRNPNVGFEMDTGHSLVTSEDACNFSFRYKSIIGRGTIEIIDDFAEKSRALNIMMSHYSEKSDWDFPPQVLERTAVMRLSVCEMTCKVSKG
ncbi:MAG: pyridoxamine 5'-phosphate oxidase family protein [Synergistes sp.]|nr:pyridoxamine 5'-phosphate oxidase family protein [Synergistes sp.]